MDWVFPADVRGWLSEEESRGLADLARDKRVLEVGSFCGRSTISMAQTALSVTCVDPFDGRATDQPGDTFAEFTANLGRYGVSENVMPKRGSFVEVAPTLPGQYDLIFIDAAHDYESVLGDIRAARPLLAAGGRIAFHDYREYPGEHDGRWDSGVSRAVHDWMQAGAKIVHRYGTVAVVTPPGDGVSFVRQPRREDGPKPLVFLAMPSYDGKVSIGAAEAYFLTPTRGACDVVRSRACSSFLTKTFNDLWCAALNRRRMGITHFAMIHADIIPDQAGWLDILLAELTRLDADVVSTVSPIKSDHGWTSTAVEVQEGAPWLRRRLTMREVYDLPETFGAEDVGAPLLMNTGLWVCDLRKPWCEQVCFDVFNRIVRDADGMWHAESISEDWLLGSILNQLGCKTYITRKVTLQHDGDKKYPTSYPWGTQRTDEVYQEIATKRGTHANQVHEGVSGEGHGVSGEESRTLAAAGTRG